MKEKDITDEQILEEVKEILDNPQMRKCCQCTNANPDCTRCEALKIPISKYQYAGLCKSYETSEQKIIRQTREALKQHEKEENKINHLLTMSLNLIAVSLLYLDDFNDRVETEYKRAEFRGTGDANVRKADRAWMSTMKRAFKQMQNHIEGVQKQYQHYIMPTYNKVFFDKETGKYDVSAYDDHQEDMFEVAELNMRYFDVAFLNLNNARKIMQTLKDMQSNRVFEDKDYKRYNFRR